MSDLADLRKEVTDFTWNFYESLFAVQLAKGRLAESDRQTFMEDQIRQHRQRILDRDSTQAQTSHAALCKTAEYKEIYSDDEETRYERYRTV